MANFESFFESSLGSGILDKHSSPSDYSWATVTSLTPLKIRLDNTPDPLGASPVSLIGGLQIGDRVWVQWNARRTFILGKKDPGPPVRRSLASTLSWGTVSGEFTIRSLGLIREIRGAVSGNLPVGSTALTGWWALPVADRPSINALGYAYLSGGFSGGFIARPDGSMSLVNQTGASRNGDHQFSLTYSVD